MYCRQKRGMEVKVESNRKVAVIGGGASGMAAALAAKSTGHR